jgi:FtsP/CotA-like multicopper oxidase with cupredoxin domain
MFYLAACSFTAATVSGVAAVAGGAQARTPSTRRPSRPAVGAPGTDYTPVITPNGWTLPYKVRDGVKVFHLIAEPVQHEFAPGLVGACWGYNGTTPGPTIEVVEGDRVRIYVTNRLPEPTSVHWHGILLPNGMDGLAGLTQKPIAPGETFTYAFTVRQHGTHMYHPHFDEMTQMALGLQGLFILHPRHPTYRPARDFALMLNEWRIDPGTRRPNPLEMTDFNVFTMNSKAFPGTAPLVAKLGDHVKIRLANLSANDHHPIHLHGYQFRITETDGGQIPESAQQVETTVLVQVGSTRAFEFIADEPGDWAMHCHMTHHVMNQMGHDFPNMIGVQPGNLDAQIRRLLPAYMTMGNTGMGEMGMMPMPVPTNSIPMKGGQGPFGLIDMGGMLTVFKVRKDLTSYDDPGWYEHPRGTVADVASPDALRRDGIAVPPAAATTVPSEAPTGGHHQH